MFRKKFLPQRSQALMERAEEVRRLHQIRRTDPAMDSLFVFAQEMMDIAEKAEDDRLGLPTFH